MHRIDVLKSGTNVQWWKNPAIFQHRQACVSCDPVHSSRRAPDIDGIFGGGFGLDASRSGDG